MIAKNVYCLVTHLLITVAVSSSGINAAVEIGETVTSDSLAIVTAHKLTGFDRLYRSREAIASAVTSAVDSYVDTITPFLHTQLTGRRAWKVTYTDLAFCSDTMRASNNDVFSCVAWIDSVTGSPLLIDIHKTTGDTAVGYRLPTPAEAEKQLLSNLDRYLGLPQVAPTIDVLSAMSQFHDIAVRAKHVIVRYLLVSCNGSEPFPAWVFYMRGYDLGDLFSNPVPPRVSSNWRMIIDAMSGKPCGGMGNIPFPESE